MNLAVAVMFLNEADYLPRLLASMERQTRPPEQLLLVDDGSDDGSPEIADAFAERHQYARVLRRPRQRRQADRLVAAPELRAFQWAVAQLDEPFDAVAKLDGDLELNPRFFETIAAALDDEPDLGIAGAELTLVEPSMLGQEERVRPWHVRGATKFYRRACWEQIAPLPEILGWDTIDEVRARMRGWEVRNVEMPDGQPLHLRGTGTYDGAVRGFRRRGMAAWGYGAHPLAVLYGAAIRAGDPPRVRGAVAYLQGWAGAAIRREARAEPELVRYIRTEQARRIRDKVAPWIAR